MNLERNQGWLLKVDPSFANFVNKLCLSLKCMFKGILFGPKRIKKIEKFTNNVHSLLYPGDRNDEPCSLNYNDHTAGPFYIIFWAFSVIVLF